MDNKYYFKHKIKLNNTKTPLHLLVQVVLPPLPGSTTKNTFFVCHPLPLREGWWFQIPAVFPEKSRLSTVSERFNRKYFN